MALETTPVRAAPPARQVGSETAEQKAAELTRREMEEYLEEMNRAVQLSGRQLQFQLHERSQRWQVFVIDSPSQQVIKELPPRELLDILGKIREMVGLLLDERV